MQCSTVQFSAVQFSAMQCSAVICSALQCNFMKCIGNALIPAILSWKLLYIDHSVSCKICPLNKGIYLKDGKMPILKEKQDFIWLKNVGREKQWFWRKSISLHRRMGQIFRETINSLWLGWRLNVGKRNARWEFITHCIETFRKKKSVRLQLCWTIHKLVDFD